MSTLQKFHFNSQQVRTVIIDGEPWFVAKDACAVLGIRNVSDAVSRLDEDGVGTTEVIDSLGRKQQASSVDLSALYELIFMSRKPDAKKFRRWVTREVLPSIRKTGSYSVATASTMAVDLSDPAFQRQLVQVASAALDRAESAEAQLAIAAPKVALVNAIVASGEEYDVRTAAQMLQNEVDIKLGRNRLFEWLRDHGWADDDNQPYQRYVERGWLTTKLRSTGHWTRDGEWEEHLPQLLVTPKGLAKIHELMVKQLNTPAQLSIAGKPKSGNRSRLSLEDTFRRVQSQSVRKPRIA